MQYPFLCAVPYDDTTSRTSDAYRRGGGGLFNAGTISPGNFLEGEIPPPLQMRTSVDTLMCS